jgi:hypothetical protein
MSELSIPARGSANFFRIFGTIVLTVPGLAGPVLARETPPQGPLRGITLTRPEDGGDAPVTPPPPGAVILFDGKNLDAWSGTDGASEAPQDVRGALDGAS